MVEDLNKLFMIGSGSLSFSHLVHCCVDHRLHYSFGASSLGFLNRYECSLAGGSKCHIPSANIELNPNLHILESASCEYSYMMNTKHFSTLLE